MKSVLAILSRPPYQGSYLFETLEAAMVTQAFDLPTSILFRGNAVNALRSGQAVTEQHSKLLGKVITALSTYEIEQVFVCRASLDHLNLTGADLVIAPELVSEQEIQAFIQKHDVVLGG